MNNSEVFSLRLKALRAQHGLTQIALSEELNLDRTTIAKWESGTSFPNVDTLIVLSKRFKCSLDWLLGLENYSTNNDGVINLLTKRGITPDRINKLNSAQFNSLLDLLQIFFNNLAN